MVDISKFNLTDDEEIAISEFYNMRPLLSSRVMIVIAGFFTVGTSFFKGFTLGVIVLFSVWAAEICVAWSDARRFYSVVSTYAGLPKNVRRELTLAHKQAKANR